MIKKGSYYVIKISDTGKGITKENIAKIFSPFFTTKTKGTGLGLASCMRIAEQSGGGIDFSTSSKGTVFNVFLPLINFQEEEKKMQIKKYNEQDVNVLLVEDQADIRQVMKQYISKEGYNVTSFGNGKDALEALANNRYDCLITDAILPEVDGSVIAKAARKYNEKIKIILISGYDYSQLKNKFPEDVEYISKPFKLIYLKDKLVEVLNKK